MGGSEVQEARHSVGHLAERSDGPDVSEIQKSDRNTATMMVAVVMAGVAALGLTVGAFMSLTLTQKPEPVKENRHLQLVVVPPPQCDCGEPHLPPLHFARPHP